MTNKIKRFFRSIGKPAGGSASLSSAFPVLASNDNQFYHQHELGPASRSNNSSGSGTNQTLDSSNNNMPILMARAAAENSGSGSDSMASPHRSGGGDAIRWGLLLPRIPRLVAEATAVAAPAVGSASPSSSAAAAARAAVASDNSVEMAMLLEMLTQMAPKEAQTQILQFYIGDSNNNNNNNNNNSAATVPVATWEQRKVFRQVRRALLLCWKFIVAQLNDNNAQLTSELRETYFQLIGLIAERIEFHLSPDSSSGANATATAASRSTPSRQQNNSGHMMGWTVHSPTASAPSPLAHAADLASSSDASGPSTTASSNGGNAPSAASDDSVDGERDLYLYRCLLVATFKFVVENIDGAKASRRAWVTIAELQFFAKVLAICFFRIPVLQRLIIDQIHATYRQKRWTNTATTATTAADDSRSTSSQLAAPESRAQRRRSSSRLSSGLTFTGSLSRWSEFEGHVLSEVTSSSSSSSSSAFDDSAPARDPATPSSATSPAASLPTRAAIDKFKRLNPTLFRWTRYVPYLTPYTDTDVFRMNDAMRLSWLEKLSHDGEFFALFMSSYTQHAETCAVGDMVWSALPAYALLVRVSLLLLKEASWAKWLYMRDNTVNSAPSSLYDSPSAGARAVREPFELRSIRSIRAVLDSVTHWLRNRELLESCTLALMECTNVLHPRSVGVCLTRCEEWFRATAVPVPSDSSSSDQPVAYRLPSSFSGLTFALGIRLMLSSESFETLTRTLQFLYDCLAYFDGELRQHVLKVLVQRHMFLFLHWHADVRSAYHHVLVYKLARVNRFFLDSPIDHLLIGRHAALQFDTGDGGTSGTGSSSSGGGASVAHGFDDFDDHLGGGAPYANAHSSSNSSSGNSGSRPFQISAAEFSALRTEQALWRAFDACISAICVHERRNAKDGNRKYQYELQCARSRAIAFQKLTRATADDPAPSSSVNEGLPGGKPWLELDLLDEELHREPPYYLRYLPAEDVSSIDELRRLASTLRYPLELHVYAAASLRHYSDLLKKYYEALSRNKYVEAPPLGFV